VIARSELPPRYQHTATADGYGNSAQLRHTAKAHGKRAQLWPDGQAKISMTRRGRH